MKLYSFVVADMLTYYKDVVKLTLSKRMPSPPYTIVDGKRMTDSFCNNLILARVQCNDQEREWAACKCGRSAKHEPVISIQYTYSVTPKLPPTNIFHPTSHSEWMQRLALQPLRCFHPSVRSSL